MNAGRLPIARLLEVDVAAVIEQLPRGYVAWAAAQPLDTGQGGGPYSLIGAVTRETR